MTTPPTASLPPEMLAKATEAVADGIYEDEHSAVIAEKVLRAADVPGLLAEVAALTEVLRETQRIAAEAQRERARVEAEFERLMGGGA